MPSYPSISALFESIKCFYCKTARARTYNLAFCNQQVVEHVGVGLLGGNNVMPRGIAIHSEATDSASIHLME